MLSILVSDVWAPLASASAAAETVSHLEPCFLLPLHLSPGLTVAAKGRVNNEALATGQGVGLAMVPRPPQSYPAHRSQISHKDPHRMKRALPS